MNWLEVGQRVEGLLEDMREFRKGEEEFPKTADKVIELLEQIITVMDEATE